MNRKTDSQEKQDVNKSSLYEPDDSSGNGLRAGEPSVDAHVDLSAQFQPMSFEACLDCAATYDPNVDYANVLASVLLLVETRDAERTERQARSTS